MGIFQLDTTFAVETADRGIKSFAQGIVLYLGGGSVLVKAFEIDWVDCLGFGVGAAVLSVATSFASSSLFKRSATPASALSAPPIPD